MDSRRVVFSFPDMDDMMELLECPVCHEIPLPPIPQCGVGHSICQECRPRVDSCPVCREDFVNCRNLALEAIVEGTTFVCEWNKYGCDQKILGRLLPKHLADCEYRPIDCPYTHIRGCDFKEAHFPSFLEHVTKVHRVFDATNGNNNNLGTDWSVRPNYDYWPPEYLQVDGHHFFTKTFKHNRAIHAFMTIFGTDADAAKYSVKIKFNDDKSGELFEGGLFTVPVVSIRKSDDELMALPHAVMPEATLSIGNKLTNWQNRYLIVKND